MRNPLAPQALMRACAFFMGLTCLSSSVVNAQNRQGNERQAVVPEPSRTATASRVDHPPKLDGTLDDPLWQQSSPTYDFLQREPFEGQAPTEKTEIRILYDKHEVYFGIACFDSDPKGIVATELRRDVSQELDDYFEIIVDSAHDRLGRRLDLGSASRSTGVDCHDCDSVFHVELHAVE
jgi:hypothetical protein